LVTAALLTGCRYGELAALQVRDFNPDSESLYIAKSKSGKTRHVHLTEEGVAFFARMSTGRSGTELILRRSNGARWGKSHQDRPMREACKGAAIIPPASFHILRHSYATLALMAGAKAMVLAEKLGYRDTRMIELHYGHLTRGHVREEIRKAVPEFVADNNNDNPSRGAR